MESDDRYVLRHEWERGQGKTYEKINEVDRKHTESIAALNNKVDRQTVLQEKAFESQSRSEKHLEKISESMGNMGERVNDLEYETKTNMKELSTVKQDIDSKKNREHSNNCCMDRYIRSSYCCSDRLGTAVF